jgi:nucleoid DNA-binding protein
MLWIFGTLSISAGEAHTLLKKTKTKEKIRIAAKKIFLFIATSSFDISRFR